MTFGSEPAPRAWIVAAVVESNGATATEHAQRAFFAAIRGVDQDGLPEPEVGWMTERAAYIALATRAPTSDEATGNVRALIEGPAARLGPATTWSTTIVSVRPVVDERLRDIWGDGGR